MDHDPVDHGRGRINIKNPRPAFGRGFLFLKESFKLAADEAFHGLVANGGGDRHVAFADGLHHAGAADLGNGGILAPPFRLRAVAAGKGELCVFALFKERNVRFADGERLRGDGLRFGFGFSLGGVFLRLLFAEITDHLAAENIFPADHVDVAFCSHGSVLGNADDRRIVR